MKTSVSYRLSEQAIKNLQSICRETGSNQTAVVENALAFYAAQFTKGENQMSDPLFSAVQNGEINLNSPITFDDFHSPKANGGFRSGYFRTEIGDTVFDIYLSVSCRQEYDEMQESLKNSVRRSIKRALGGNTKGYTSQSKRIK